MPDALTLPAALRLPLAFDADALRADLAAFPADAWHAHYNTRDYDGDWSGIPLRSPGGLDILFSVPSTPLGYHATERLRQSPAFRAALGRLAFPLTSVRLLRLAPGAVIKEHTDQGLSFADGEVRLHVPVETNDALDFRIDGRRVAMQPGELWYLDAARPHAVTNGGPTPRTHLVIDGTVNDWVRGLFGRAVSG